MRYARVEALRQSHPVAARCRVLAVSESGDHAWRQRPPSARAQENRRREVEIKAAHPRPRETDGPERRQVDLADPGVQARVYRVKRTRSTRGLRCKQKRKCKATTNSKHGWPLAPNLLDRPFPMTTPNQAGVTDITDVATEEGGLYLAGIKDLFNGEWVGYARSERMTTNRVSQALFRAVAAKRPAKGLIHHSDRGSQYCAPADQAPRKQFGMMASMSRQGNGWDHAPMERFSGSLKNELVHHQRFVTREQARQEITEDIETFYNRIRKQARLGYLSPTAFNQQYYPKQMAA